MTSYSNSRKIPRCQYCVNSKDVLVKPMHSLCNAHCTIFLWIIYRFRVEFSALAVLHYVVIESDWE